MKKIILILLVAVVLIAVILGVYFLMIMPGQKNNPNNGGTGNTPTSTVTGVQVEIKKEGTGNGAEKGDTVTVHYVGMLANGTKFDSSIDRNAPFVFTIGQNKTVKGFEMGIMGMKAGERRRITVSPEFGYGATKLPLIPVNSTLIYDVEMIKIVPGK